MASKSQSRGGSPAARRPKLMRASATAPSLATSNASRKDLASLQNSRASAATLLTRVASYSSAQQSYERAHRASVGSICSTSGQQSPTSASSERKEPFEILIQQSGSYYSFPSFEEFQDYQENEERRNSRQESRVL